MDCPFSLSLCQTLERDRHAAWHQPSFNEVSDKQENKSLSSARSSETSSARYSSQAASTLSGASQPLSASSQMRRGRPKGSINKR